MKEKEIHNLSKSLDSARSTIKALRYKKSQLKNSKTKLKTGITKIKKVETTKKKVAPISKQKAEDLDENHLNPGALSETSEPESLLLPSMALESSSYENVSETSINIIHDYTLCLVPSRKLVSVNERSPRSS